MTVTGNYPACLCGPNEACSQCATTPPTGALAADRMGRERDIEEVRKALDTAVHQQQDRAVERYEAFERLIGSGRVRIAMTKDGRGIIWGGVGLGVTSGLVGQAIHAGSISGVGATGRKDTSGCCYQLAGGCETHRTPERSTKERTFTRDEVWMIVGGVLARHDAKPELEKIQDVIRRIEGL